jgi:hypothetical protein
MDIDHYIEYQRREYCKALPCPIQTLLDQESEDTPKYEQIRSICKDSCLHTTYEFHHYLIQKGYLVIRPPGI